MANNTIWGRLQQHKKDITAGSLAAMFDDDPGRAALFLIETEGLYVDYSKNYLNKDSLALLLEFAIAQQLPKKIERLFSGEKIDVACGPALHTALRAASKQQINSNGCAVTGAISAEQDKVAAFTTQIHTGQLTGGSGKRIDTVVNLGIGGAELGPRLVIDALQDMQLKKCATYFISNIDPYPLERLLERIDPERTLFIVSSKSFTTLETLQNATTIKAWLKEKGCDDTAAHFVAVTANVERAVAFGITRERIFKIWEWVGGRYSLWSAAGLVIAIAIGYPQFQQLLAGARGMDRHFREAPPAKNAPIVLALLDCWYSSFFNAQSHAIVPYDSRLALLPAYLAQLIMESNGKRTDYHGQSLDYQTAPAIFGATGTNAQHAFFQSLHQGSNMIPVDLLAPLEHGGNQQHHDILFTNCIAQAQTLMQGAPDKDPHKSLPGNKPSTTILYKRLTPTVLGALLALFEHRTFVQSIFWGINPFNQWGVELGKKRAKQLLGLLSDNTKLASQDTSTRQLLQLYLQHRPVK